MNDYELCNKAEGKIKVYTYLVDSILYEMK